MGKLDFSAVLYKLGIVALIIIYLVILLMVMRGDLAYADTVPGAGDGATPVPAPPPQEFQLINFLFTSLTTGFALYTGKILGIEISKAKIDPTSARLGIVDKFKKLLLAAWEGITKQNLPKIGAALFMLATLSGFIVYVIQVGQVPGFSDQPISELTKNLASSFVGLIIGIGTSGDSE